MVAPSPPQRPGPRPFARWLIGLLVLLGVWILGFGACFATVVSAFSVSESGGSSAGVVLVVVLGLASAALYIAGPVLAWRAGRRRAPTTEEVAVAFGWHVSEPGADLRADPRATPGGDRTVWLPPGTRVVETGKRWGGFMNVTTPDGQTGWLDRREVHWDGPP